MSASTRPAPSRLRARDTLRVAFAGLRTRPLRAVLAAAGIAVGIAAMVTVVGISASSREQVNEQLRELGTNLLTVAPGQDLFGGDAQLPEDSVDMVARIGPVNTVSAVGAVEDTSVYRNNEIPEEQTNGLTVNAARTDLLDTVSGTVASGRWLDDALASYPTVCSAPTPRNASASAKPAAASRSGWAANGSRSSAFSTPCRWLPSSTPPP